MVHRILNKPHRTMAMRGRIVWVVGVIVWAAACRSTPSGDEKNKDGDLAGVSTDGIVETAAGDKSAEAKGASLGQGTVSVFGIKVPTGMVPAKGPDKVYRFEGRMPAERVATLIRNQIVAQKEQPENDGVLFRFAEPKKAEKSAAADRSLAIRVFPNLNGAALDIWLEREYVNQLPNRAATTSNFSSRVPVAHPVKNDENRRAKQKESLRNAMTVLKKIQQHEPLTEEEKKSRVFD
jgi:hypothetical protein